MLRFTDGMLALDDMVANTHIIAIERYQTNYGTTYLKLYGADKSTLSVRVDDFKKAGYVVDIDGLDSLVVKKGDMDD